MREDEARRPPVLTDSRPATAHECISAADSQAAVLMATLQQANASADPVLHLLLAPLISDVAKLGESLRAIEIALETRA